MSFVGRWSVAIHHGLALGELARLWVHEGRAAAEAVAVEGWERTEPAVSSTRPRIPISPAMPTARSAAPYPGTNPLEA